MCEVQMPLAVAQSMKRGGQRERRESCTSCRSPGQRASQEGQLTRAVAVQLALNQSVLSLSLSLSLSNIDHH